MISQSLQDNGSSLLLSNSEYKVYYIPYFSLNFVQKITIVQTVITLNEQTNFIPQLLCLASPSHCATAGKDPRPIYKIPTPCYLVFSGTPESTKATNHKLFQPD